MALMVTPVSRAASPILTLAIIAWQRSSRSVHIGARLVIMRAMPSWLGYVAGSGLAVVAAAMTLEELGAWRDRRRYPPPGQFVRVGRRRIHVRVAGRGAPTVVLEAGSG